MTSSQVLAIILFAAFTPFLWWVYQEGRDVWKKMTEEKRNKNATYWSEGDD